MGQRSSRFNACGEDRQHTRRKTYSKTRRRRRIMHHHPTYSTLSSRHHPARRVARARDRASIKFDPARDPVPLSTSVGVGQQRSRARQRCPPGSLPKPAGSAPSSSPPPSWALQPVRPLLSRASPAPCYQSLTAAYSRPLQTSHPRRATAHPPTALLLLPRLCTDAPASRTHQAPALRGRAGEEGGGLGPGRADDDEGRLM